MDVNLLIKERKENNLIESLESIRDELKIITLPVRRSFNEKGRQKKALLNKVNELTLEVEAMMKSINERKDIESIKLFTKRVREIVEEKEKISAELLKFKDQA
ncbi:MAG: hypothetical protein WC393_04755 [Candidatus Nanoarchaeia archaeon]|jgi:hypothetical protein